MSWRTIDSKVIAKDRWISLRADHCIDERGTEISPYYVLEYPDWVHIVCIDDAERICLIEQYRHGVGHSMFELPCGFVEPEEAPLAAAERELREETGIVASDWVSLGTFSPNPATHTNWVHLFGCRAVSHGPNAPEPTESLRSIFVTIDELERMIESGRFGHCCISARSRPPACAASGVDWLAPAFRAPRGSQETDMFERDSDFRPLR